MQFGAPVAENDNIDLVGIPYYLSSQIHSFSLNYVYICDAAGSINMY